MQYKDYPKSIDGHRKRGPSEPSSLAQATTGQADGATPSLSLPFQPFWHLRRAFRGSVIHVLIGDPLVQLIFSLILLKYAVYANGTLKDITTALGGPKVSYSVYAGIVGISVAVLSYSTNVLGLSPNAWIVRPHPMRSTPQERISLFGDIEVVAGLGFRLLASQLRNPDLIVYKDGPCVMLDLYTLTEHSVLTCECDRGQQACYDLPEHFILGGKPANQRDFFEAHFFIQQGHGMPDYRFHGRVLMSHIERKRIEFQPIKTYKSLVLGAIWWALIRILRACGLQFSIPQSDSNVSRFLTPVMVGYLRVS